MYSPESSGHQQAALAIQAAIREIGPEAEVLTLNFFNYSSPVLEKMIVGIYLGLLKTIPKIWGYLYDNPRVLNKIAWLRRISYATSNDKIQQGVEILRRLA